MNNNLAIRLAARKAIVAGLNQEEINRGYNKTVQVTFEVGMVTTCQFGNSFDSDWSEETSAHQQVEILDIKPGVCNTQLLLVKKVGKGYVGVATVTLQENIKGVLYCTRAVDYESGDWPGISTEAGARAQLGW